jgi:hypothetical protein
MRTLSGFTSSARTVEANRQTKERRKSKVGRMAAALSSGDDFFSQNSVFSAKHAALS